MEFVKNILRRFGFLKPKHTRWYSLSELFEMHKPDADRAYQAMMNRQLWGD